VALVALVALPLAATHGFGSAVAGVNFTEPVAGDDVSTQLLPLNKVGTSAMATVIDSVGVPSQYWLSNLSITRSDPQDHAVHAAGDAPAITLHIVRSVGAGESLKS